MTLRELLDAATEGHEPSCRIHGGRPPVCDCGHAEAVIVLSIGSTDLASLCLDMAEALQDLRGDDEVEALLARLDRISTQTGCCQDAGDCGEDCGTA